MRKLALTLALAVGAASLAACVEDNRHFGSMRLDPRAPYPGRTAKYEPHDWCNDPNHHWQQCGNAGQ